MIKIKMHAMYDHFPDHNPAENEPYIDCYSDTYVKECKAPGNNIALLLEPRSMIGEAYDYVFEHETYFKYIFTHDSKLLTLPQAKMFVWCDVWLQTDLLKSKGISLVTSYKNWCPLHNARLELADYYKNRPEVDVYYGDWNNPNIPTVDASEYLSPYKYSIIIENDIDDFWYTEKILNCFSTKTVPIYLGARKIYQLFNADGIIEVKDWHDIPRIIEHLNIDEAYANRQVAIEDNYERVKPYKVKWKERFFGDYEKLLEEMLNG